MKYNNKKELDDIINRYKLRNATFSSEKSLNGHYDKDGNKRA